MTREDVMNALHSIFRTILKDENIELTDSTTANDVSGNTDMLSVLST